MEFLSEAVGEVDSRLLVGVVLSVFAPAVGTLLSVVTERLHGLGDRQAGEADFGGPGLARRQPLRSHRQPGNRPARPSLGSTPASLARSMRCFGRAPISHYRHRRWIVAFWRAAKLNLLPVRTLPKSAFTAVDWRYEPLELTELAAAHPFCGGFELRVRLHRHENRWHLRRSLQAAGLRARSQRLIVIASARDVFDPGARVRCFVVDADTVCLPKQSRGWAAVRGADPSSVDVAVVDSRKQDDVPDGAVWLIVPTSAYCPPAEAWWKVADHLDQQEQTTVEATPQHCLDIDNEGYIRAWVRRFRRVTLAIWVVLGPSTFVVAVLALAFVERFSAGFETLIETGIAILVWYWLCYVIVAEAACGQLLLETLRAWSWRHRENQAKADWKGGTDECLIVGGLLRRGPILRPEEWNQHCAQTLPQ